MRKLLFTFFITAFISCVAIAAVVFASPAHNAYSSPPACQLPGGPFGDSFDTHYNTLGGLNPNACPGPVITQPQDGNVGGTRPATWWDNTTAYNGSGGNCIEQGTPPTPGKGTGAVRIHADAYSSSNPMLEDCIWMAHWRYINYPADTYYGLMWYLPSKGFTDPSGGGHDIISEFDWHPYIYYGPLGYSLFGDTLQWRVSTGAFCKPCRAQYANGAQYENPGSAQLSGNLAPIQDWRIVPKGSLVRNTWIETIVHVHWANDTTGSVQAWYRYKSPSAGNQNPWIQTINQSGFPTLDWGPDSGNGFQWTPDNQQNVTTQDHIGVYRTGQVAQATTFWIDNFQEQSSFNAVASTMP